MFDIYFGKVEDNIITNDYTKCNCPLKFYIFHGHKIKDIDFTNKLINNIKLIKNNS
jgi:hypothetical protein